VVNATDRSMQRCGSHTMKSLLLWKVYPLVQGIWERERRSYSLPLQVLRYRMRWFKVSEGGRLLKAPRVMSSIRSAVRGLLLAMVMAFVGVGLYSEGNEWGSQVLALNQFQTSCTVGNANVINRLRRSAGVVVFFP
jgi:hypothetical protein